jgi:hypothetical protein
VQETELCEVHLSEGTLRRIARLHARVEGQHKAYEASVQSLNVAQTALQEALNVACEDLGMNIPSAESPIDIDWKTGRVWLREEGTNGRVHDSE